MYAPKIYKPRAACGNRVRGRGPRTSPGTTTISVSHAAFNDLKTSGKTDFRYLEWWKVRIWNEAKVTSTGTVVS